MNLKINEIGIITRSFENGGLEFMGQCSDVGNSQIFVPSEEARKKYKVSGKEFAKTASPITILEWVEGFEIIKNVKTYNDEMGWKIVVKISVASRHIKATRTLFCSNEPTHPEIKNLLKKQFKRFGNNYGNVQ